MSVLGKIVANGVPAIASVHFAGKFVVAVPYGLPKKELLPMLVAILRGSSI
jgi:hypothetical protein